MVDASRNVGGIGNFQMILNFIATVFHSFTLGNGIRYALVVFGGRTKV